jgi:hypothetical protein
MNHTSLDRDRMFGAARRAAREHMISSPEIASNSRIDIRASL